MYKSLQWSQGQRNQKRQVQQASQLRLQGRKCYSYTERANQEGDTGEHNQDKETGSKTHINAQETHPICLKQEIMESINTH